LSNGQNNLPVKRYFRPFYCTTQKSERKLYVGVGAYKAGIKTEGTAWYKNANVLRNMIRYARNTNEVDGFIIYSYKYLISKRDHKAIKNMLMEFK